MKIFTAGLPELCQNTVLEIESNDIIFEHNFEQIIGLTKQNILEKLCIYKDVWNCNENFNCMRGQKAAEKIHEVDPNIEILIWEGRQFELESDFLGVPSILQVSGIAHSIKNRNELYLSFKDYALFVVDITVKFFNNSLLLQDIPLREQL